MTNSSASTSSNGDQQGPAINVESGTSTSTGPAAARAPEPLPGADRLSPSAAPSIRSGAAATVATGSAHHPSPESQASSATGSLCLGQAQSTELSISFMGGGLSLPTNLPSPHGTKRPRAGDDAQDTGSPSMDGADGMLDELDEIAGDGTEPGPAGPACEDRATSSGGQRRAKRMKHASARIHDGDDGDGLYDGGDDNGDLHKE